LHNLSAIEELEYVPVNYVEYHRRSLRTHIYYYEFWMGEESAGKMKKYKEVKREA